MRKHIDPLSFDALLLVAAVGLAFFGGKTGNKNMLYTGAVLGVFAFLYLVYLTKLGKAHIVENKYNGTLPIKPESGQLDSVGYGILKPIDGIKRPGTNNKPVRKFSNGVNVRIDKHGNATAVNLLSRLLGQTDLATPPDQTWKPIFEH